MYIQQIKIENFRCYGSAVAGLVVDLRPGLTALVGENDSGKTAIVDALRYVLGTRDLEYIRVDDADFHLPAGQSESCDEMNIRLTFAGLDSRDQGAFLEHLTYPTTTDGTLKFHLTWTAKKVKQRSGGIRFARTELRSGIDGDGPTLDIEARELLRATYLRPLRDAKREMSAGRRSRLSQILEHTPEVASEGDNFNAKTPLADPTDLSVLGVGDFASYLLSTHEGIAAAKKRLNEEFLGPLSFQGDDLKGHIGIATEGDDSFRRRQLLEKLALELRNELGTHSENRGLGSNNLMFMACELLLLSVDTEELPLLLIEEPEAHLHPQRQLLLMRFLQERTKAGDGEICPIQVLVTTHSPTLASAIELNNLVMLKGGRSYALRHEHTKLEMSDYRFLERFLDSTKANLFFARAVAIVEGDAEAILLPVIAQLIESDFDKHGVSIVNVGHVGLFRFARIFQRANDREPLIDVPVACIADMDVLPDCAPAILGMIEEDEDLPEFGNGMGHRGRRVRGDFNEKEWENERHKVRSRADGGNVKTFVAECWTLEYELAASGLAREVWIAAALAKADDAINSGKKQAEDVKKEADESFTELREHTSEPDALASHVYAKFITGKKVSKSIAAQYLCEVLAEEFYKNPIGLREKLPVYLLESIEYLCRPSNDKNDGRGGTGTSAGEHGWSDSDTSTQDGGTDA